MTIICQPMECYMTKKNRRIEKSPLTTGPPELSVEIFQRTIQELETHQIELELQNEELKKTQAERDALHDRYFDLYDLAPVGYLTLNANGLILEANLYAATLFGLGKYALLKQPFYRFVCHQDKDTFYLQTNPSNLRKAQQGWDMCLLRADGSSVWAYLTAVLINGNECWLTITNINERKNSENIIAQSLREKEVMLKEIHHRVKNNLTIIRSLLSLQAIATENKSCRIILDDCRNRIMTMSMIHEKLYKSELLSSIDFKPYLQDLVDSIARTVPLPNVHTLVKMENLIFDLTMGIPCGLIVNELVSNCRKHAFPEGREGMITLGINKNIDGKNVLTVEDSGVGLSEHIDFRHPTTLGLNIVNVLTKQLQGTMEVSVQEGTKIAITFPDLPTKLIVDHKTRDRRQEISLCHP